MRRQADRDVFHLLDRTILELEDMIVRFDQCHFPDRAVEARLDKFINHDRRKL